MKELSIYLIALLWCVQGFGQTLIINEVSQGESGNMEYIEIVVADSTVVYNCASSVPPSIDIRGWIIDDNSGYHGTSGIASGAIRFSNAAIWSAVPVGTLILIYNDGDPNPLIPADDLSMADGNCTIVAPVSDATLFEQNAVTPGAVACSYPAVGWAAGGDWNNIILANGGDCVRIVDLSGCEVFSLCWGSDNLNTQIYFAGGATSGSSATNTVYYFNDTDPASQANWSIGCADVPACGVENQTPGAPNNAANQSFIDQFNNGCAPIPPIVVSATANNGPCPCSGQATASASGSIGPYDYTWYDNLGNPIGQDSVTAVGLCDGTYEVVATSSIGCSGSATVTITNSTPPSAGSNGSITVCEVDAPTDLFNALGGTPDNGGVWSGPSALDNGDQGTLDPSTDLSGTYTYTIVVGSGCPDQSADVSVTVVTAPSAGINGTAEVCSNASINLIDSLGATPDAGGAWSGPSALSNGDQGTFDASTNIAGVYSYTVLGGGTCPDSTADITVTITQAPNPGANGSAVFCPDDNPANLLDSLAGSPDNGGTWTGPSSLPGGDLGTLDPSTHSSGTYTYTITGNGSCPDSSAEVAVTINPFVDAEIDSVSALCVQDPIVTMTAATSSGTWSASCGGCINSSTGEFDPGSAGAGTWTVYYSSVGPCPTTDSVLVVVDSVIQAAINPAGPFCESDPITIISAMNSGGTWSASCGSCIDPSTGEFDPSSAGTGNHTITYTTPGSCGESQSISVTVTGPVASFSANPSSGDAPLDVQFTNTSSGASTYQWNFDDGNTSSSTNPTNTFEAPGDFEVTLVVSDTNGCSDVATLTIVVESSIFIPQAFSPDGDGFNDVFEIPGILAFPESTIKIYNRWGDLVYSASPYLSDWDGTSSNKTLRLTNGKVVDGTYFYFLDLGNGQTFEGYVVKKSQ